MTTFISSQQYIIHPATHISTFINNITFIKTAHNATHRSFNKLAVISNKLDEPAVVAGKRSTETQYFFVSFTTEH